MELRQLQYFLACADKGSLTAAAEELYTSQPHVSQVIRALERELGKPLFKRTGSGIVLTDEGEKIRFYAENALKNASLIQEVCESDTGESLKIATNSSSTMAVMAEDFFCESHKPDKALYYTECGIEEMMDYIHERGYDLGFVFMPSSKLPAFIHMTERKHLEYTQLATSDLVVHCSKSGPFYGRDYVEPEELSGCKCIKMEDDFFSVEELLYEHEAFRSGKAKLDIVVRTNSDHLIMDMLRRTGYCNIGSYWSLKDTGISHAHMARVRGFEGKVSFGYLKGDNRPLSRMAETFLDKIKDML